MFIEKTARKLLRFNLNETAELEAYNRYLQHPSTKVIDKQILSITNSHFEKDYSTTETQHIMYLEIEECSF